MAHGPTTTTTTAASTTKQQNANNDLQDDEDDDLPIPPDGGWGWVVVFASFMIHIITDGMTYSFGIFYVEFLEYFNEGKGYTAWILSILVGVTLCSGPISSFFVTKYGCRLVTIAGALLAGCCLIISIFAKNVLTLICTIGLGTGMGLGLIYLPAIVSVTMYFEKYRSLATGIAVCGSGFGTFIFAPLTEYLVKSYTWRGAMLIIAAIVLNCIIFGAMFRPVKPSSKKGSTKMEMDTYGSNSKFENDEKLSQSRQISGEQDPMIRSQSVGNSFVKKNNKSLSDSREFNKDKQNRNDVVRATVSQPFLNGHHEEVRYKPQQYHHQHGENEMSRTMSRPDILYQGSLHNIPQFRSNGEIYESGNKYGSIRHLDDESDMQTSCCNCTSGNGGSVFASMLNFSLLKDPIFIIFVLSNFCTSIGFNIPYVYIAAQAEAVGLSKQEASYLLAIIGIANTVGRIILGYVSDKPWVNRLLVYNLSLTICGVATALSILCQDFYSLSFYSAVFGFTIGAYVGLTSVILVDLLGLDKLTNAFGLLLLFQGIASLVGPPIAGALYDLTMSYSPGFILAGVTVAASGLILFGIPAIRKYNARRGVVVSEKIIVS